MTVAPLSTTGRYAVLAAAFLGWMFSGVQMTLTNLASGSATEEFVRDGRLSAARGLDWSRLFETTVGASDPVVIVDPADLKRLKPRWYALYNSGFLLGAAAGGLIFGWLGDRFGRVRAMGASILCYSLLAGLGYLALTPEQFLMTRFLSGMGVGGMWPTGVSLAAEAWADVSRPTLSGLLGTAANVGIVLLSAISLFVPLTPDSWRWVTLVGMLPGLLGVLVLAGLPESPAWLASRERPAQAAAPGTLRTLFRPPLLRATLIGIAVGTIPLLGGWGVTNWFISWTEAVKGTADFRSRAWTALLRAAGGSIGSLCGGWIANLVGRRTTYFVISLLSFGLSAFIYLCLDPRHAAFGTAVFAVGMISTVFFGWLPLYLPELFPTAQRATGSGISFNFGRILTAIGVLGTGALTAYFQEDYRLAGAVMSLIYATGMVVILFAPDTTGRKLVTT